MNGSRVVVVIIVMVVRVVGVIGLVLLQQDISLRIHI